MRVTGKDIIEFCDEILAGTGRTIASVCKDAGLQKATVSMWRGHPELIPKLDALVALSEALNVSVSELIGQTPMTQSLAVMEFARMEAALTETEIKSVLTVARTFFDIHKGEKSQVM